MSARRVAFRFGLTGRSWGEGGPIVLLVHGREDAPALFAQIVTPLVASGRQVVELDDPTTAASGDVRMAELAAAISEAAVELRGLEAIAAHGLGAAATAQALTQGLAVDRVVLLGSGAQLAPDDVVNSLTGREKLRLAA
jgi:alpha-beta hydrolase superfamily lysophospholipase